MKQFRRDSSGALINTDKAATQAYKQRRERTKKLETDINTLTYRIDALETLIQQLLRGTHDIND
jgi:hypothetical protein